MQAEQEEVLRLLKTARGQIDGLIKMVKDDRYCIDISNQLLATNAVLRRANHDILKAHLNSCVKHAFQEETEAAQEVKINEVMQLIAKMDR